MTEDQKATLMAYYAVAGTESGRIMIEDMRSSFVELQNPALLEELAAIPHPYRAYVEQGMGLAVRKVEGVIALAEHCLQHGFPTDDEETPDET